jgi:hypothetical protein
MERMTEHPEDLPWNDVPADSDVPPGSDEPDPAEVVGDEDDPAKRDLTARRRLDQATEYTQEALDQRLAEEEPDVLSRTPAGRAGEIQAPEDAEDDIDLDLGEPDGEDPVEPLDLPAEEDAIRLVDDDDE